MHYRESDVLTFASGIIGCVTKHRKLACIHKNGCTSAPHYMPSLDAFLVNNTVVHYEPAAIPANDWEMDEAA